jgi:hypothetical protein
MELPSGSRPEIYRERRKHTRRRPRSLLLVAWVSTILLLFPAGWLVYKLLHYRPSNPPPDLANPSRSDDRRSLLAYINKMVAQTGKNLSPPDLIVMTATLHNRDNKVYLAGTVKNQSSHLCSKVHIIFDSFDQYRNPAGVLEADVGDVQPGKDASFDIGPVNPTARACLVRSIVSAR